MSSFIFGQKAQVNKDKWEFGILSNVGSFYFDGDYKILDQPFAGGINYKGIDPDLIIGAYVAPSIINTDDSKQSSLSVIFPYTELFYKIGGGLGYDFWQEGRGIVSPDKDNLFFVVTITLVK